ncbi:MAG: hypothetical protein M3123_05760, partial [Actinomycetota bacterium]|nr:hypothetical protein [Actinomycetota bacterium]
ARGDGEGMASPPPGETSGDNRPPTTTGGGGGDGAAPRPLRVRIDIPPGGAERVRRIEVSRGRRIVLVVASAVEDELHVHGYDLLRDVGPGTPRRISFRATIPGRFEIELEEEHERVAELVVRP